MKFKEFLKEHTAILTEKSEIEEYFGITLTEEVADYSKDDVEYEVKIKGVMFKVIKVGANKFMTIANDQIIDSKTYSDKENAIKSLKLMKNFNG